MRVGPQNEKSSCSGLSSIVSGKRLFILMCRKISPLFLKRAAIYPKAESFQQAVV